MGHVRDFVTEFLKYLYYVQLSKIHEGDISFAIIQKMAARLRGSALCGYFVPTTRS